VTTLLRLGRNPEADRRLAEGIQHFGDVPELVLLDARQALREGRFERARLRLEPLAERRDEIGGAALAWLATTELVRGRPQHAVGTALRALTLVPHDGVATYALALALAELRSPDAAAWLSRARRTSPGDPLLARLAREFPPGGRQEDALVR
jgi:predicted Zn-dependent protease